MNFVFENELRRFHREFDRDYGADRQRLLAKLAETKAHAGRPSRHRLRSLSWWIPVAAAAAVVLIVGLWPAGNNGHAPGRVYALSDVPALMNSARMLHIRVFSYDPCGAPPDGVRDTFVTDWWFDQVNSRWVRRGTYGGQRPLPPGDPNRAHWWYDRICDGQYQMWISSKDQTVTYEKLTGFWPSYELKHARDLATLPMKEELLDGFTFIGQERLDDHDYQVWEQILPPVGEGQLIRWKLWFSPQRGEVSQMQCWERSPLTNDPWVLTNTQLFEPDATPPPGTFSTEPPPGYRTTNTKEAADLITMRDNEMGRVGRWSLRLPVSFELPGRVVLFGWSCIEQDKAPVSQEDLFKDLVAGGPLPQLPLVLSGMLPNPRVGTLSWAGFHLAHTVKNGRDFEWSLYVPNQPAPPNGIMGFELELRPSDRKGSNWGCGDLLQIDTAEDFDEFVLRAMAELSDTGTAPAGVTYDGTMQLIQQLKTSTPAK